MPAGVSTEIDPETAVAIGQPPRVALEAEGEGEEEGEDATTAAADEPPSDEG